MNIGIWLQSSAKNFSFQDKHLKRLEACLPGVKIANHPDADSFKKALPGANIAIVWVFKQEWLENAPGLEWIATPAAGRDYFNIKPVGKMDITYGGFHGEIIAETVLAMMLSFSRGIYSSIILQDSSPWPRADVEKNMRTLRGSHALIVGFGNIGQWIGRLAKAFGMKITGVKRTPGRKPDYFNEKDSIIPVSCLDQVLPEADHVILSLPRSPATDLLINESRLSMMKKTALLYNIGRGNAVDEDALATSLKEGSIAGAALDVFQSEPLPVDSQLRDCPNIILMPHASAIDPGYLDLFLDEFVKMYREKYR